MKYNKYKLDPEEQEILEAFEAGKLVPIPNQKKMLKYYQQVARNSLRKSRNINLRVTDRTYIKLKAKALEEGLPYQTLAASILHKYAMS